MITATIQAANLGLRFALEMFALIAIGLWSARAIRPGKVRPVAVTAIVVGVTVAWSQLVHGPGVSGVIQFATQVGILAAASLAAARLWRARFATIFCSIALANAGLMAVWNQ